MPVPFDMGAVVGPVSNEGTHNQLRTQLKEVIRGFLHSRPNPINVQTEQVDQFRIRKIVRSQRIKVDFPISAWKTQNEKPTGWMGRSHGRY